MLKTERNTTTMERAVMRVAVQKIQRQTRHWHLNAFFEHGNWWVSCRDCGATWSVVDAEGPDVIDGLDLEDISDGDGSCL